MKNIYTLIFASLIATNLYAAEPNLERLIAVVDVQEIIKESTAAKNIRDQIEKKRTAYQAEINKRETDLNKKHQELSKQQSVLSKEAFDKKLQDFDTKVSEVQRDVQDKRAKLDQAYMNAVTEIQQSVEAIISDIAAEKGFLLAVPTSQILYAKENLDISDEVLKRLNQRLTKVNFKIE